MGEHYDRMVDAADEPAMERAAERLAALAGRDPGEVIEFLIATIEAGERERIDIPQPWMRQVAFVDGSVLEIADHPTPAEWVAAWERGDGPALAASVPTEALYLADPEPWPLITGRRAGKSFAMLRHARELQERLEHACAATLERHGLANLGWGLAARPT